MEVIADSLGLDTRHHRRQSCGIGLLYRLYTAEMFEEATGGPFSDAGDFEELGGAIAHLAALAVEGYGEAVGLYEIPQASVVLVSVDGRTHSVYLEDR